MRLRIILAIAAITFGTMSMARADDTSRSLQGNAQHGIGYHHHHHHWHHWHHHHDHMHDHM